MCKKGTYLTHDGKCTPCPEGSVSLPGATAASECVCKYGYQGIISGTYEPSGKCEKIKESDTYLTGGITAGPEKCNIYPINCGLKDPKKVIQEARKKYLAKQEALKKKASGK